MRRALRANAGWHNWLNSCPPHINYDRLIGGLDLAATLQAGRPIAQRGLLAEADGGVALLAMAERLGASTAAHISAVIDTQELVAERHGIGERSASRIGVIALDEGIGDDEQVPSRLRERLAFHVTLPAASGRETVDEALFTREHISQARDLYVAVRMADDVLQGLCAAALALGIDSVRAPMLACRAARPRLTTPSHLRPRRLKKKRRKSAARG